MAYAPAQIEIDRQINRASGNPPGADIIVQDDDAIWRLQGILAYDQVIRPDYGQLPDDPLMWAGDRLLVQTLLDNLMDIAEPRYPMPPPPINDHFLKIFIGFDQSEINCLLSHDIIKPVYNKLENPKVKYHLCQAIGDAWFRSVVENL